MYSRAASGTVVGVAAHDVIVEAHRARGLPGLSLIGLARGAVRESAVRVRSAVIASGIQLGSHRMLVNLLPAELEKDASALDLALAVALLAACGALPLASLAGRRFFGELSLGGGLEAVRGAVLLADLARHRGDAELILPRRNAQEAAVIPGIRVIGADTLAEVVGHLDGSAPLAPAVSDKRHTVSTGACLSEVHGQERAKRALEIAAAGGHNLLLMGPPGSGKTMLARRLPGLLPPLSAEESIEVTRIHSAAGLLKDCALVASRPFRAPHHTASDAALCGGGSIPRPGEITLAHRGVLFLDELPEFSRRALESLREPLEEGQIHIARAAMSLCFPARVLLVAAMNPCPCGRLQPGRIPKAARAGACVCTFDQVQRYRQRISGPLLDRIDMHVLVDAVPYRDYALAGTGEPSQHIRERVLVARQAQVVRLGPKVSNASMEAKRLRELVPVDRPMLSLLEAAIEKHGLSTRALGRILKVSRTIADLEGAERVSARHVAEAASFRILDSGATETFAQRQRALG